jgi:hypothetical protein
VPEIWLVNHTRKKGHRRTSTQLRRARMDPTRQPAVRDCRAGATDKWVPYRHVRICRWLRLGPHDCGPDRAWNHNHRGKKKRKERKKEKKKRAVRSRDPVSVSRRWFPPPPVYSDWQIATANLSTARTSSNLVT